MKQFTMMVKERRSNPGMYLPDYRPNDLSPESNHLRSKTPYYIKRKNVNDLKSIASARKVLGSSQNRIRKSQHPGNVDPIFLGHGRYLEQRDLLCFTSEGRDRSS